MAAYDEWMTSAAARLGIEGRLVRRPRVDRAGGRRVRRPRRSRWAGTLRDGRLARAPLITRSHRALLRAYQVGTSGRAARHPATGDAASWRANVLRRRSTRRTWRSRAKEASRHTRTRRRSPSSTTGLSRGAVVAGEPVAGRARARRRRERCTNAPSAQRPQRKRSSAATATRAAAAAAAEHAHAPPPKSAPTARARARRAELPPPPRGAPSRARRRRRGRRGGRRSRAARGAARAPRAGAAARGAKGRRSSPAEAEDRRAPAAPAHRVVWRLSSRRPWCQCTNVTCVQNLHAICRAQAHAA